MTPLALTIAALATYRVATAIAHEDGPWRVFARLREHAARRTDDGRWPEWVEEGLHCPRCVSVWAALVIVPAMATSWAPAVFVVTVLAVSGAACVLVEVA